MTTMSATAGLTRPALSVAQLGQLRAALEEQRRFRLAQIAELERGDAAAHADPDVATALGEVTATLLLGAWHVLEEIDAALSRAAAGGYGQCTTCADPIPVERLEILPMAALCMPCQRRREQHDRATSS